MRNIILFFVLGSAFFAAFYNFFYFGCQADIPTNILNPLCDFINTPTGDGITVLHNLGLAIVIILIPFGVVIFQELINSDSREFKALDLKTILEKVFNLRSFYSVLILVFFFSLALMLNLPPEFKILFFSYYVFGVLYLFLSLRNLYSWISSEDEKWKFRKLYLSHLVRHEDWEAQRIIWSEIWNDSRSLVYRDDEFFKYFQHNLRVLWERKDKNSNPTVMRTLKFLFELYPRKIKNFDFLKPEKVTDTLKYFQGLDKKEKTEFTKLRKTKKK